MEPDPVFVLTDVAFNTDNPILTETEVNLFVNELARHLQDLQDNCSVEILFTGDDEMAELNARYRKLDRPTDVLSFPDGEVDPETGRRFLGSIAVSEERARQQAAQIGHDVSTEVRFLILHGVLHLLGYDHETDDGTMLDLQRSLQSAVKLKTGGEPVS